MNNFSGTIIIWLLLICCICVMTNSESLPLCTGSFMADPDDCTKYYKCDGSQPIRMSCPSGAVWNAKMNACDAQQSRQYEQKNNSNVKPDTPAHPSKSISIESDSNGELTRTELNQPNSECGTPKKSICYSECELPCTKYSNARGKKQKLILWNN